MDPVSDLRQFSQLVKDFKSFGSHITTNCFLLPQEISILAKEKRLFWSGNNNELIFVSFENNYSKLYFFIKNFENPINQLDLRSFFHPVIIDLIYSENKDSSQNEIVESFWSNSGFRSNFIYKYMELNFSVKENLLSEKSDLFFMNYQLDYAKQVNAKDVLDLWKFSFEKAQFSLPNLVELLHLIENKQIICVFDQNHCLASALQMQVNRNICEIKHVAVEKNHQRLGLANYLLNACFEENENCKRFFLWVEAKNEPAIKLYEKMEFRFSGKILKRLILLN